MNLKSKIEEILNQIKKQHYLTEAEQKKLLDFFSSQKINEGDVAKLIRLNNSAMSVRKKKNKIPALLKILIEVLNENVELRQFKAKIEESLK